MTDKEPQIDKDMELRVKISRTIHKVVRQFEIEDCPECKGWGVDRRDVHKPPCDMCKGTGIKPQIDKPDKEQLKGE